MYNLALGAVTLADVTPFVGKIVSIRTSTRSLRWGKFTTVADPLSVEIVKQDGSSHTPAIVWSIPLAEINKIWEYGTPDPEISVPTPQVTAGFNVKSLIPWAIGAGGLYLIYRFGFLAPLGFAPSGHVKGHPHGGKHGHSKKKK